MIKNILFSSVFILMFSGCLQTRSELGAQNQSQVYRKKNIENQQAENETAVVKIDEKDELIRALNGRLETLENQVQLLQKEKTDNKELAQTDAQKIQILQDTLAKLENQIARLEHEKQNLSAPAPTKPTLESSDDKIVKKHPENHEAKKSAFDIGEELFKKKDYKKAILSYQQFVEENAKSKSVPEAKYKIGVCFQELGMRDEAIAFYEEVIAQYPKTDSGKKAKIRHNTLIKEKK